MLDETAPINGQGKSGGDSTIAQTVNDVREKAVSLKKDGTPRKTYTSTKRNLKPDASLSPTASAGTGVAGFTEDQIRASAKGLFSLAALSVDCNVWFLSDDEANTFVPSLTLGLNQAFPSVAASKWGALSLAALSITAIVTAKTLAYLSYKADVRRRAAQPTDAPPTSAT